MVHQMYYILSNLMHIDVNIISLTNHSTTPSPDPIQNMHTSSAISYSFQGYSPQKFPNLETSLGTPPPVAHQAPRGWGQKSLCVTVAPSIISNLLP